MKDESLQAVLQHSFADPGLLERALTHSSWANEHRVPDNERLEFLGDSVLNTCTSILLFEAIPKATEGQLSRLRARLVNTDTLAELGTAMELGPCLRLGVGEESSGGRTRKTVLADAVEAILGALYLDAGFDACLPVVKRLLGARIAAFVKSGHRNWKDPRSALQERVQKAVRQVPEYVITDTTGPDHAPQYHAEVRVGERVLGTGQGSTKREAFARAAQDGLDTLKQQ